MRVKCTIAALAIAAATTVANAGEGWLCVEEWSAGIKYFPDRGGWDSTRFTPVEKYLIRQPNEDEIRISRNAGVPHAWVILRFGAPPTDLYWCDEPSLGVLKCESVFGSMQMYVETLRFVATSSLSFGYLIGDDTNVFDLSISAGTCAPM